MGREGGDEDRGLEGTCTNTLVVVVVVVVVIDGVALRAAGSFVDPVESAFYWEGGGRG